MLVFSVHYVWLFTASRSARCGWIGVDLFFVLSGFLITGILYDTRNDKHFFRTFYTRRALRIFPLYWGFFALLAICWLPLRGCGTSATIWTYAAYIGNLVAPAVLAHGHNPTMIHLRNNPEYALRIDHFWSLCVEEQFYLAWPLAVWVLRGRRALMRACAAGIVATVLIRAAMFFFSKDPSPIYQMTYARADSLLAGGLLALALREWRFTRATLRKVAHWLTWPALALLLVCQRYGRKTPESPSMFMETIGYTLLAIFFVGVLLWSIDERSALSKTLRRLPLSGLGRISYGFYFFHELYEPIVVDRIMPWMSRHHIPHIGTVALTFAATCGIAWFSYRFWESPFLRLKDKISPPTKHSSIPPGAPAVMAS